jgi:hypothetical protein
MVQDLNETFNSYFYKKVTFLLDNKPIKDGRLKLFTMKGFNLKFFLVDEENLIKNLELPYPFKMVKTDYGYIFDYRLEKFKLLKNTELLENLEEPDCPKSRFYNKPLIIKIE